MPEEYENMADSTSVGTIQLDVEINPEVIKPRNE